MNRLKQDKNYIEGMFDKKFDDFAENTLSNYYLPFGIAPNFKINNPESLSQICESIVDRQDTSIKHLSLFL